MHTPDPLNTFHTSPLPSPSFPLLRIPLPSSFSLSLSSSFPTQKCLSLTVRNCRRKCHWLVLSKMGKIVPPSPINHSFPPHPYYQNTPSPLQTNASSVPFPQRNFARGGGGERKVNTFLSIISGFVFVWVLLLQGMLIGAQQKEKETKHLSCPIKGTDHQIFKS